jgi:hypothetical protein
MLLTMIGAAVAISAAVIAHGTAKGNVDSGALLGGLWAIVGVVAEGLFFRLVRARQSICRDIEIVNRLRDSIIGKLPDSDDKHVLRVVATVDSKSPRVFSPLSSPGAASTAGTCAAFASCWFVDSDLAHSPPAYAYLVAALVLIVDLSVFGFADRRFLDVSKALDVIDFRK